jgi:hypothetical protein
MSSEAVREMTFEEEYEILKRESEKVFATEDPRSEPPLANCVLRRALRCIRKLQEQQENKWILCEVKDIIDTIISHNEIVALCVEEETEDVRYDKQIWRGMAWDIPNSYKGCRFVKMFGTVPESIAESDTINIRIELPQPYKKEGAENESS